MLRCCVPTWTIRPVSFDHFPKHLPFFDGERQRFFRIEVFARPTGRDVDGRVPVVGRAVDDHLDVLARVEQLAVVLEDGRLAAQGRCGLFRVLQIDVADGDDVAEFGGALHVVQPSSADADGRHEWPVVLGPKMGRLGRGVGHPIAGEAAQGAQARSGFQELSARCSLSHGWASLGVWMSFSTLCRFA